MARLFRTDRRGAAAVEMAILAPVLFVGLLSMFDLGLYFWRWNQAVESARVGARLAAVSNPVATELKTMTGLETGVAPGEPAGAYQLVCAPSACSGATYDASAMARIFYGPGAQACVGDTPREQAGMCDVMSTLALANVTVSYRNSGVDTAGVEGALRPLVSVRISGAAPQTVLLEQLFPGAFTTLPATEITVLAEDLRSDA